MTVDWSAFTPANGAAGGLLIGAAAVLLMLGAGRIAGISGILGGLLPPERGSRWRLAFLLGLCVSPWLYTLGAALPAMVVEAGTGRLILAGLLVGAGTRFASGCTSGHGVCGLSRGSRRSFVATAIFMAAGFAMVYVLRHLVGG
ncbi:YeeE/YedE family protein [Achromobacter seleniivolatilans]|uniref:YeeE/YedE family protein n=1 Tax=Achromobacter seleniivolatilans TaxID=3047478 RepID=A0ABY9LYF1_9BURK|nr:YeeE/YedE family protein [Achromobacter sp. R39]WMD19470.1 YeeE/YedE family protein [Achromobacter sp. R39]